MKTRLEQANRDRNNPDGRYASYEQLRTPSGVFETDSLVVVTGYEQARFVLQNADDFSSNVLEIQGDVPLTKAVKRALQNPLVAKVVDPVPTMMNEPLIFQNGERHAEARSAIAPALRPALIEPMQQYFAQLAVDLVAQQSRRGRLDVVRDLAAPMSARVVLGLFGVGTRHDAQVRRQVQPTIDRGRDASFLRGLVGALPLAASQRYLRSFFFEYVLSGNESEATPLLGAVKKRAAVDGPEIAAAEFIQLLVGGMETTQNLIVNGVRRLVEEPDVADALRSGALKMAAFRQEVLRHDSPSQIAFRLTQRSVRLADVSIASGRRVAVVIGACNRDPQIFTAPETFMTQRWDDTGRPMPALAKVAPLSFGAGVHACPGYFVAGAEADAAWNVLLHEVQGLRASNEQLRSTAGLASKGVEHLPVLFEPTILGGRSLGPTGPLDA